MYNLPQPSHPRFVSWSYALYFSPPRHPQFCFALLGSLRSCASTSIAVIDSLLSRSRISMAPSHPSLSSSTKLYEMNPNDQSLHLVLLLLTLPGLKILLPLSMISLPLAIP